MERKLSENYKARTIKRFDYLPWMAELADYYVSVVNMPIYRQYFMMNQKFADGLDPIPDRDLHKDLLVEMGHDLALIALPPGSAVRKMILGKGVSRETYLALHGVCVARLMLHYPTPFEQSAIRRLHGLLDRLLFGGASFDAIDEVPMIGPWFWEAVRDIKSPKGMLETSISLLRERKTQEEIGGRICRPVCAAEALSLYLLSASSAVRHSRRQAAPEDVRDAATSLTKIFYVDVTQLDPPRRVPAPEITARRR